MSMFITLGLEDHCKRMSVITCLVGKRGVAGTYLGEIRAEKQMGMRSKVFSSSLSSSRSRRAPALGPYR